jgi:hypothetical protein
MATTDQPWLDYPFRIDGRGRTGTTASGPHLREMIEQVLFTDLGERVNRPDFGCGLKRLVFMPNSQPLAAATQVLVKSALQKWLGDLIQVESVDVTAVDSTLTVALVYTSRTGGTRQVDQFTGAA